MNPKLLKTLLVSITISLTLDYSSALLTSPLSKGSKNTQVKELETFLLSKGYFKYRPDNVFNNNTHLALYNYQKNNKLIPTGIVGKVTREYINREIKTLTNKSNTKQVAGLTPISTSTNSISTTTVNTTNSNNTSSFVSYGGGGGGSSAVTLPSISLEIAASSSYMSYGSSSRAYWSSANANFCTSSHGSSSLSGVYETGALVDDLNFSVSCYSAASGTSTKSYSFKIGSNPNATSSIGTFTFNHSFPYIETDLTPISLSHLNPFKAGSQGRIISSAGHLYINGSRIRLYGMSFHSGAFLPTHEESAKIAARLKKEGFNAARISAFDMLLFATNTLTTTFRQQGVLNSDHSFNLDAMDRIDYFINELQKNGMYIDLPVKMARKYLGESCGTCEGVDNYLINLIDSQKNFASSTLNHHNAYTGYRYKDDPGIFNFEINNENSLTQRWANGTIDLYQVSSTSKSSYVDPLSEIFRSWTIIKYGSLANINIAWLAAYASTSDIATPLYSARASMNSANYKDWMEFMGDTETEYWSGMYDYFKNTLGTQALVTTSQSNYVNMLAHNIGDMTDVHRYFGDLGINTGLTNPANNRPVFEVENRSQLHYSDVSQINQYGISELKSTTRPSMMTEYAYRDGNQYSAEQELFAAAYASFQDLDAIFLFNYHSMNLNTNTETYPGWYNMTPTGSMRPAAAMLFRRGDLTPGTPSVLKKTKSSILSMMESWRLASLTNFHFGGNVRAPYTKNMYFELVSSTSSEQVVSGGSSVNGKYTSSSGEIVWTPQGSITINSHRTKAAIGYFKNSTVSLGDLTVDVRDTMNNYAVLSLTSLSENELLPATNMLFSISGFFTVPGEYPRSPGGNRYSWGTSTPILESIPSVVTISTSLDYKVTALNSRGERSFEVPVVKSDSKMQFVTGPKYNTSWYLIEKKP